jgi:hypothetical protein
MYNDGNLIPADVDIVFFQVAKDQTTGLKTGQVSQSGQFAVSVSVVVLPSKLTLHITLAIQ